MIRALPAPLTIPAWKVWVAVYVAVNLAIVLSVSLFPSHERDWSVWEAVPRGLDQGRLYDLGTELPYVLSPLMAPIMALAGFVGVWVWGAVQIASVLLVRSSLLVLLILTSWGFWTGLAGGSPFIFAVVAGVLAVRGGRTATIAYMALLFLMPRPVQVPLALWLLWTMPWIRVPTLGLLVANVIAVLTTGYADEWVIAMSALALPPWNIGPTHWIGLAWLALGLPLGAYLLWRARFGWAGLAWSTYLVPHNLLMPIVEPRPHLPALVLLTLAALGSEIVSIALR